MKLIDAILVDDIQNSTKIYNRENDLTSLRIFLPAVKYVPLQEPLNEYCFILDTTFNVNDDNLVLTINIQDKPQDEYDYARYGESSEIKGKQSVDFLLLGAVSKDLFRLRKGLKRGESNIVISPSGEKLFKLCFNNYVYDGSWNSFDIDKYVTVDVSRFQQRKNNISNFIVSTFRDKVSQKLEEIEMHVNGVTGNNGYKELIEIEEQRRNKNENTFDKLLYAMITFTGVVVITGVLQIVLIRKLLLI